MADGVGDICSEAKPSISAEPSLTGERFQKGGEYRKYFLITHLDRAPREVVLLGP